MRVVVISVLASSIVTLSVLLAFYNLHEGSSSNRSAAVLSDSSLSASSLQARITSLSNDVNDIQNHLNKSRHLNENNSATEYQENFKALNEKIEELELALDQLSSSVTFDSRKNTSSTPKRIREYMAQTVEVLSDQQHTFLEGQFESDSGIPLGDFDSSIEDVIQKLGGIQAQGIDCRNTICKVAYSVDEDFSSESTESEELDWQLMEKLLERSGGRRVDIRYANDSFGNRNMYIQLN